MHAVPVVGTPDAAERFDRRQPVPADESAFFRPAETNPLVHKCLHCLIRGTQTDS